LVGEPEWVSLPKQVRWPPAALPTPAVRQPIDEGFESTDLGKPAANATTSASGATSAQVSAETAAGGKRSLKLVDAAGAAQVWHPHVYWQPQYSSGTVRIAYDLRVEAGAIAWLEGRDAASPYNAGPSLRIEGGQLRAGAQVLMPIPTGQWLHYEIALPLGKDSTGTYALAVTLPGGEVKRFESLALAKPAFKRLQWVGFMSMADGPGVYYVDNLKVERVK
jgi:hypothetical protein